MNYTFGWRHGLAGLLVCGVLLALLTPNIPGLLAQDSAAGPAAVTAFDRPTYASPIALDASKNLLWVVNPDDDSVSVIGNLETSPSVIAKVNVGDEPQSIALDTDASPQSYHAYVANAAGNSVTVITVENSSASNVTIAQAKKTLTTGSEPWSIVASPDGTRVFVANSGQDTITIIRTDTQAITGNVDLRASTCNVGEAGRHFQPHGMAVSLNNQRLFVTRFLSFTKNGGVHADDVGKEGIVCQLDISGGVGVVPTVVGPIALAALDTGFKIDKNKDGTPDPTLAYPNQLRSIVIRGNQAYVPNIASSTSGPLKFNVDTQSFVNVIDNAETGTPADAGAAKSINMHLGARDPEQVNGAPKTKLFFANPWAIAFTNESGAGDAYAVSAGSDLLVRLKVDASGALSFTVDANTTRYIDLNDPKDTATSGVNAGKNPLGIVIRNGTQAYVMNYISRNVSVVDLGTDKVTKVVKLTDLPIAGSQDEQLQVGKEIFFSSRGHFDRPNGATVSTEDRLSSEGWQNCASCHFAGLTDGNVWSFAAGPRKSVPMNGTWSPHNPDDQRLLNYSAIFDEVQDFEINIRNVSGPGPLNLQTPPKGPVPCAFLPPPAASGTVSQTAVLDNNHGLIIGDDGDINKSPCTVVAFNKPNAAGALRKQLTVTLPGSNKAWDALDSMKEWVRFAIRTPNGMLTAAEMAGANGNTAANNGALTDTAVSQGRRLFFQAGCQKCHGGSKWTSSSKDFVSPPAATDLFTEAGAANTVQAQFLNRFLANIDSFALGTAANPIGNNVGAAEFNETGLNALGKDHNNDGKGNGFNTPSLLGIWHVPPYYHNGACETLACVVSNEKHRKAGNANDPIGSDATKQGYVVAFLQSLDAETRFPLDLRVFAHDIFLDPPTVLAGQPFTIGVNVSLFGGKPDLLDLAADVGATTLTVRFQIGNDAPIDVTFAPADFAQDFGQARVIKSGLTAPSAGVTTLSAEIDPGNQLPEDREDNNKATRRLRTRTPPPDKTPPVVNGVFISDDANFNDNDPITVSRNVKVKIKATDPAGPNGEEVSGLDAYCLVRYTYNVILRRWVEEDCTFKPLPNPETGTTDTFIVDTELKAKEGVAYAFAWVRDGAGNISRQPGFDVISYIPTTPISLDRNDVRIFRIPLAAGNNLTLNFNVDFGDIDVSVFDDFTNPDATRCDLSAQNGPVDETISLPGNCPATPGRFQVEVRAAVNSRFTITTSAAADVAAAAVTVTQKVLASDKPIVGGPPARQAAIEDEAQAGNLYLPLIIK